MCITMIQLRRRSFCWVSVELVELVAAPKHLRPHPPRRQNHRRPPSRQRHRRPTHPTMTLLLPTALLTRTAPLQGAAARHHPPRLPQLGQRAQDLMQVPWGWEQVWVLVQDSPRGIIIVRESLATVAVLSRLSSQAPPSRRPRPVPPNLPRPEELQPILPTIMATP